MDERQSTPRCCLSLHRARSSGQRIVMGVRRLLPAGSASLLRRRQLYDAAGWTAYFRLIEHLIHDSSDGVGTTIAPSSATKAGIDRARCTARCRPRDGSTSLSLNTLQEHTIIAGRLPSRARSAKVFASWTASIPIHARQQRGRKSERRRDWWTAAAPRDDGVS